MKTYHGGHVLNSDDIKTSRRTKSFSNIKGPHITVVKVTASEYNHWSGRTAGYCQREINYLLGRIGKSKRGGCVARLKMKRNV